jgi:two-component system, OmpR family, aerobic respiration control sensor histidine kinase ArcB
MRQIKTWVQLYVDWITRIGIIRFSLLLAFCIISIAVVIQGTITLVLRGEVDVVDLVRSVFFGLLVTPWAAYFLTAVIDELEDSRRRLTDMVHKLQVMRERDQALNQRLQNNISQLNSQIEETRRAEAARLRVLSELEAEAIQREKAQKELEEQSTLLRSFLDSSPDLVFYRNEREEFLGCNKALEKLLGRSQSEIIGRTPYGVYEPQLAEQIISHDREVFEQNTPITYELWFPYPDGRRACFEMRQVPFFDAHGERLGLVGFGRDITEHKRYQDELEKASQDKTTFISTISHELRTPLNGVVGLSHILLDTPLNELQRQYLNTIHLSAVTLGNIFNDIIDLDKIERRRLKIANSKIDLRVLLADLQTLSKLMVEAKGLYLHFDIDGDVPHWIMADGTRLRQILWNVLSNAVKFTTEGGINFGVQVSPADSDKVHLRFDIEDTGIGIPENEQQNIFAMYYQVPGTKRAVGTGIGLAITQQLVEAMGGAIQVDSELGHGSCFTIELEVAVITDGIEEPNQALKHSMPALRILMVEDIALNVTVATAMLNKLGHQVDVAMTGAEALTKFIPGAYDLVLLDIQLPDMTGFDVADELQTRYPAKLPPLVALTANLINNQQQYQQHGMQSVIGKPLSMDNLRKTLSEVFVVCPVPDTAETNEIAEKNLLDINFLQDFTSVVGCEVMASAIDLFDQSMPDYMNILNSALTARDKKGIVEEAHKIKSAAGAIGLKRIYQLAQQAQSPDLPAWQENIHDWIDNISAEYPGDLKRLRSWLQQQRTGSANAS